MPQFTNIFDKATISADYDYSRLAAHSLALAIAMRIAFPKSIASEPPAAVTF